MRNALSAALLLFAYACFGISGARLLIWIVQWVPVPQVIIAAGLVGAFVLGRRVEVWSRVRGRDAV